MNRFFPAALAAGLTLALAGCGYHTAGHAVLIPKTVKTIAIPAFANGTTRYKLARLLPADITREFISRTHYTIVADPEQADAVLTGSLANFFANPTTSDPNTGRATGVQVMLSLNVTLTDRRTGKILYSRPGAEFHERYEVTENITAYFDESGTAMERVSRDVARSVVTGVLEAF